MRGNMEAERAGLLEWNAYSQYEKAQETAESKDCDVIKPEPNELFLDIDTSERLVMFGRTIEKVNELIPCRYVISKSSSGKAGHYHVVVTLTRPVRDNYERIMLQAILASDCMREALSWQRVMHGDPDPVLLFKPRRPQAKAPYMPAIGEVADHAPRWVFSGPKSVYGADSWLGLVWAVLTRAPLWTAPETSKAGGP